MKWKKFFARSVVFSSIFAVGVSAEGVEIPVLANVSKHVVVAPESGESYTIFLRLPPEALADPERKFPLLVTLDGDHLFPQLVAMATQMGWGAGLPPVIVAGIGYDTLDLNGGNHRSRDYSPFPLEAFPGSGGGEAFLSFLLTTALPRIAEEAPVDADQRYLLGHSLGGLLTLYAFATEPEAFAGFLVASPFLQGQTEGIFSAAQAASPASTPSKVFVATGGDEDHDAFLAGLPAVEAWLGESCPHAQESVVKVIPGFLHYNSVMPVYAQGLLFLLVE